MTELDRHKAALKVAIGALRELGLDYAHFTDRVEKRIAAILEPPQEFEPVEAEAWAVIDTSSGKIWNLGTKEDMEIACDPAPTNLLKVVRLAGPYQRPVKREVVKEVSVEALIGDGIEQNGWVRGAARNSSRPDDTPFTNHPECHGKTGKLIFQWTE